MSNPLAIATATATLRAVIVKALPTTGFTTGLPDVSHVRPDAETGLPPVGVNICLYRVSPNPHWRNADLPTRRGTTVLRKPQIGLDLYYLLSFYGDDKELEPQRLLGHVVNALHAEPQLPRATMTTLATSLAYLTGSDLAAQSELVRITPTELSLEELTKLWSVFFQTKYVLSAAYTATVVLIEADTPTAKPAPPVKESKVIVRAQGDPWIDEVIPETVTPTVADPVPVLRLRGRNLRLQIDGASNVIQFAVGTVALPADATDTELAVPLPAGVAVGENWVRLTNDGGLGVGHQLATSNTVAFTLRRLLSSATVIAGPRVRADVLPAIGATQPVQLVLLPDFVGGNRIEIPVTTRVTPTRMEFDVATVPPGDYLAMLDVGGQVTDRVGPVTL